jgi:hypothetical protein
MFGEHRIDDHSCPLGVLPKRCRMSALVKIVIGAVSVAEQSS